MDSVVHFEIPTEDLARAKEFYSSIFDWDLMDVPDLEYTVVTTTPVNEQQRPKEPGAINGGMFKPRGERRTPVIVINVDSVDDYLKKIEAGGGTLVDAKMEVPGMGYAGYFRDTEGNIIGLWENLT